MSRCEKSFSVETETIFRFARKFPQSTQIAIEMIVFPSSATCSCYRGSLYSQREASLRLKSSGSCRMALFRTELMMCSDFSMNTSSAELSHWTNPPDVEEEWTDLDTARI